MNNQKGDILTIPVGKIRCYVHEGVLRNDTPEELVRQRVARSLVEEYGYSKKDLHIEFSVVLGSKSKRVDIAIFPPNLQHKQENIFIIVEAKREEIKLNDRAKGIEQLKSYLSACINAKWGLWIGSEMVAYEKETDPERVRVHPFIEVIDIPRKGETEPHRLDFSDLVPATEGLRAVFKRCHNYIHVNGNLSKEKAFFELLKLIFCKLYDESETSGSLKFSITTDERKNEVGKLKLKSRIGELFKSVQARYPYIFPNPTESIDLDNRSLAYVVAEIQKYSLIKTSSDIKGEAYEEIVGVTSRRDHGAFFTPRNVCDMAVKMVLATFPVEKRLGLKVLDPACGTGGFLRAILLSQKEIIQSQENQKYKGDEAAANQRVNERVKDYSDRFIFGIDKIHELVRAAQMNLAFHGDGASNIFGENSLVPSVEWKTDARKKILPNSFDIVVTNPPFGSRLPIDDPHILERYHLANFEAKNLRSSMPPEQLFVECCMNFLKPGGRLAIVLPDSILSNPGLSWLRRWILANAWVIASVDLPRETFARSDTHTMTSVLILKKYTESEKRLFEEIETVPIYEIFMAIADKIGWDLRGNSIYKKNPEGYEILERRIKKVPSKTDEGQIIELDQISEEPLIDDQLPLIVDNFEKWIRNINPQKWMDNTQL